MYKKLHTRCISIFLALLLVLPANGMDMILASGATSDVVVIDERFDYGLDKNLLITPKNSKDNATLINENIGTEEKPEYRYGLWYDDSTKGSAKNKSMTNYNWSGTYNPDEHNVEARAVVDPTDTRDIPDEQKNRVGRITPPECGWSGITLRKILPKPLNDETGWLVITGKIMAPIPTTDNTDPVFHIGITNAEGRTRNLVSFSNRTNGSNAGSIKTNNNSTNFGIFRRDDNWIRFTVAVKTNEADMTQSPVYLMASGNGNVAAAYNGEGVSSLKVTDKVMSLAPSAFNAADKGTLTTENAAVTVNCAGNSENVTKPSVYLDDFKIFYPGDLTMAVTDTAVSPTEPITVKFSHNVDVSTVTADNIKLAKASDPTNYIEAAVAIDPLDGETFTLTPASPLDYGTEYIITANSSVVDIVDSKVSGGASFTTERTPFEAIQELHINEPANLDQDSQAIEAVSFTATTVPADNVDTGLIEWYVDGVKQNTTGPAFTFTPPAGLGSYAIYAKVKNTDIKSEERTVSVTGEGFSAITSLTINRPSNLSQTLDGSQTPIVFTVKPNPDTNVDLSLIEWYVNGTLQAAATGSTEFTYTPSTAGTFEVYAKVSGLSVVSDTRTIRLKMPVLADIPVMWETFDYDLGHDFETALPSIWSKIQNTGTNDEYRATGSIVVKEDPENPNNKALGILPPNGPWMSYRLSATLPQAFESAGTVTPLVVSGLAKVPRGTANAPGLSLNMLGYNAQGRATGLVNITGGANGGITCGSKTVAYRKDNGWVRYTALITPNPEDLSKSTIKCMLSGNGNISATNGGESAYITTQEYTINLSNIPTILEGAPELRYESGYGGTVGDRNEVYADNIHIYYPRSLTAEIKEYADDMLIDDPIVIDFNHNVDPNTLTDETITLKNAKTLEPVEKTISFDPLNVYSVTLTPSAPLAYDTEYVVEFSPAVTDIAGFTIADPVTFTTQENRGSLAIRLSSNELTLSEEAVYSDLKVFVNDVEADASQYTVDIGSPAVADWVDGKIVTGIPGDAEFTFRCPADRSKTTLTVHVEAAPYVPPTPVPDDPIRYVTIPSEAINGAPLYANNGTTETWDYVTGTPPLALPDPVPSLDADNTVLAVRNGTRQTLVSKMLTTEANSTYVYETKIKILEDAHDFQINMGDMPLLSIRDNDGASKRVLFGNSADNVGYTLPVDKWVVFKAVLNLNEGKKIVKASYYIDGIEQYQAGQEPAEPYSSADKLSYKNAATGMGEVVRLEDTQVYKTIWLSGVRAQIEELKINDEEFNSASQITRPGTGKIRVRVANGTRDSISPVVVVAVYEGDMLASISASDGSVAIAPDAKEDITMEITIPDGMVGETMQVMIFDSLENIRPLLKTPLTKEVNTGGRLYLEAVYGDNMILQRDEPINISGTAPTGTTVTVSFAGKETSAVAEGNRFTVMLPAEEGSFENRTLTVTAEGDGFSETKTINNVQVGDVYYASGQSNMDWQMSNTNYGDQTIPEGVRYMKVAYTVTAGERVDRHNATGGAISEVWKDLNTSTKGGCSALMFFTAQKLRNEGVDVPIGIVDCSLGGTSISRWVGEDVYLNEPGYISEGFRDEHFGDAPADGRRVGSLYYNMFKSVSTFTYKGAVWYQAEHDYGREYEKLLPAMIHSYRQLPGWEDVPWFIIQLPGHTSVFRSIRYRQDDAVRQLGGEANGIYQIITSDTGDKIGATNPNIHPSNKDVVGDRIARMMLAKLYGVDNIPYSGPRYKGMTISGNTVTLTFDYVNDGVHGGLCSMNEDGSLPEFELAPASGSGAGTFVPATAKIVGDTVELTAEGVDNPAYVRYGNRGEAISSLATDSNGVKLPLAVFRTDGKLK